MEAVDTNKESFEQYLLAGSPDVHCEQLTVLAEHSCSKIRRRVAENPKTPPEILWSLSQDSHPDVRIAVAGNPGCDWATHERLIRRDDVQVRHGIAQSVHSPVHLLRVLAEDDNGWVRGEALRTLEILASKFTDEVSVRRELKRERIRLSQDLEDEMCMDDEMTG